MKAVIQRVKEASVMIDGHIKSEIGQGYLILLGVEVTDTEDDAQLLAVKIANLRICEDENGKMNLSLLDVKGSALIVSQFTLLANCRHGRRPDFFGAAKPDVSIPLYEYFTKKLEECGIDEVKTGEFGADMQVSLVNDGPVTICLDTKELR